MGSLPVYCEVSSGHSLASEQQHGGLTDPLWVLDCRGTRRRWYDVCRLLGRGLYDMCKAGFYFLYTALSSMVPETDKTLRINKAKAPVTPPDLPSLVPPSPPSSHWASPSSAAFQVTCVCQAVRRVAHRPAASPGSWLEMQALRPRPSLCN